MKAVTTSLSLKKSLAFGRTPKPNDLAIDDTTAGATSVSASSVFIAAAAIAGLGPCLSRPFSFRDLLHDPNPAARLS